jgi:hypothetical protein
MMRGFPIQRHDATRNASDDIRTKQMMMPSSDNDFNMKIAVAKGK